MAKTKILFLDMDAAQHTLVREWAAAGVLPNVAALMRRGLTGATESPPGFYVGAVWASFYTGVTPARHGIHSWEQLKPGTYEFFRCLTPHAVKRAPFWQALSKAGKRVAVFDVPHSGVTPDLNGIQSVEWGAHDHNVGFMTWPPALADEILTKFGPYPLEGACNADNRSPADFASFRDTMVEAVHRKAELTCHYLRQGKWDFFAQVFTEPHCIGHQCWHFHDPACPRHDPAAAAQVGDPVRDVYVAIDEAIGRILAEAGDDTLVILLMGHGMGYKYGAYFLLPEILVRLGVAAPAPALSPAGRAARGVTDAVLSAAWRATPAFVRRALRSLRNDVRGWIDNERAAERQGGPRHLDPAASLCFIVDNNHTNGALRFNLKGREPHGQLERGPALDRFCDELTRDLLAIVDLDHGKPAFTRVMRTADLYQGEYLGHLPDLLLQWNNAIPLGRARLHSPKIGTIEGTYKFCRTGDHRPEGMFVVAGSGVRAGTLAAPVSVMDFAPSFAQRLGVTLPDIDGRPIAALVQSARAMADAD